MTQKNEQTDNKPVVQDEAAEETALDVYGDTGTGWEDTKPEDLSIPFLNVLQPNSPQVVKNDPVDARAGMFYNTVTHELTDGTEGLVFLPCHKVGPKWVEWIPRSHGRRDMCQNMTLKVRLFWVPRMCLMKIRVSPSTPNGMGRMT